MSDETKCGLFAGKREVPLEGVRIDARLDGLSVAVTVTVWAVSQFAVVKSSLVLLTVKGAPLGTLMLMARSSVGSLVRTTV